MDSLSRMTIALPIDDHLSSITGALATASSLVLIAAPGAGKTTRVPPALARIDSIRGAIVMLQPRRVAARAAAARIAQEQRWILGREVGYHVRFDRKYTAQTRIRIVTEGILERQIASDPFLEGIGCVVLDEFHERSIHTDVCLALLREIQRDARPDLRIVVMSATLDPAPVARYLGDAPVISVPGRLFPVEIAYRHKRDEAPLHEQMASAVRESISTGSGHVLAFLPGWREIRRTGDLLSGIDADVHLLHSSVSAEDQDRALAPSTRRKVILATNIAETSITIDGVTTVIDSGLARVLVNDPRLGIDALETRRISVASADQRAGRAGRTAPGRCLRLWTRQEHAALEEETSPEIQRIDMMPTILSLHHFGIASVADFPWFDPPRREAIESAEHRLRLLGALDAAGRMTALGQRLAALPLHPRLGAIVLSGARHGLVREAASIGALLSERDILAGSYRRGAAWEGDSDLLDRIDLLDNPTAQVDPAARRNALRIRDELVRLMPEEKVSGRAISPLQLPLHGYPDRVATRREPKSPRAIMVGGRGVVLDDGSTVRAASHFLCLDMRDEAGSPEARVSVASSIDPAWLGEVFPHLLAEKMVHRYDSADGRIRTVRQRLFLDLVLREINASPADDPEGASAVLLEGLRTDRERLLADDEDAAGTIGRISFLRGAMPELELPAPDDAFLDEVLADLCAGATSRSEALKRGVSDVMLNRLSHQQRDALGRHAPVSIQVPSGSRIRLVYTPGEPPVLSVRIQELFGLAETPRVAAGRVPVVVHLLAPNYRPAQVTRDLASFWRNTYPEVRKELRARYPKHPWPEDPTSAPPVAVGARRRPS